ncbi:MAG: endonuclease domain-containing protein [Burkholderiaceae bacterium]
MSATSIPSDSLSRSRERARVRARALRRSSPDAECLLWQRLRDRQVAGAKFRRQRPIGPYFADFACLEQRLMVELDGGQHFEAAAEEADARRTKALNALGFTVLRFTNHEALAETDGAVLAIYNWLLAYRADPHPNPLPQAGEGVNFHEDVSP